MWRPGNAALSRLEKHNRVARPTESARRPGRKFSRGGGLELQSGYALPPFQAAAFPRLILIDAESQVDCRAALALAAAIPIGPEVRTMPLAEANAGLAALRDGRVSGAVVLTT